MFSPKFVCKHLYSPEILQNLWFSLNFILFLMASPIVRPCISVRYDTLLDGPDHFPRITCLVDDQAAVLGGDPGQEPAHQDQPDLRQEQSKYYLRNIFTLFETRDTIRNDRNRILILSSISIIHPFPHSLTDSLIHDGSLPARTNQTFLRINYRSIKYYHNHDMKGI